MNQKVSLKMPQLSVNLYVDVLYIPESTADCSKVAFLLGIGCGIGLAVLTGAVLTLAAGDATSGAGVVTTGVGVTATGAGVVDGVAGALSVLRLGAATGLLSSILAGFFLSGIGGGGKFGSTFW